MVEKLPGTFFKAFCVALSLAFCSNVSAQVAVLIDAEAAQKKISPYIYGRNNSLSSTNPNWTLPQEDLTRIKDAGVTFFR